MPTPPTLIAFAEAAAQVASGAAVTTASVSWLTNDVVTVMAGTEGGTNGETLVTPTTGGSGITFGAAQQLHNSAGSDSGLGCWSAVASAGSSGTFTEAATHDVGNRYKVIGVWVHRGSAGIGNSQIFTGATPAGCSLTPSGADGAICWGLTDWAAAAVELMSPTDTAHNSATPGPTALPVRVQQSPNYSYYLAVLDDQTSAGAVNYGIAGAGTGPFTTIAIEVKSAGGPPESNFIVQSAQAFTAF